jgi:ketosteroid isomerase-like protein
MLHAIKHLSMRTFLTLLLCVTASFYAFADVVSPLKALQSADDARVAAMRSPDSLALSALLSEDLRYAHSNGVVDTRASLMEVLLTGKTKYLGFEYQERNFTFPVPGIALMNGRARVKAATSGGEMDSTLSFLAVWREEAGQWRFLAWQSCKVP